MLIIICILGIIASAGGMPEPAAGIVGWVSKIGLGVSIVFYVRNAIKSELATIEKISHLQDANELWTPNIMRISILRGAGKSL